MLILDVLLIYIIILRVLLLLRTLSVFFFSRVNISDFFLRHKSLFKNYYYDFKEIVKCLLNYYNK